MDRDSWVWDENHNRVTLSSPPVAWQHTSMLIQWKPAKEQQVGWSALLINVKKACLAIASLPLHTMIFTHPRAPTP